MSRSSGSERPVSRQQTAIIVIVLAVLWLGFSGKLDALHLGYGAFSVTLVVWVTRNLMVSMPSSDANVFLSRIHWATAFVYPFWLLWRILAANIAVAKLVLSPRLAIDPVLIQLDTPMTGAMAQVVLGNSITLTPGTITLEAEHGRFVIHALQRESARELQPIGRRVSRLFGESENEPQFLKLLNSDEGSEHA